MPGPMITCHSARKLNGYLVRVKLYPLERPVGSCKCYGKRYEVYKNVTETSIFTSTLTQNNQKINHQFNCREKCLVHLLTCNECFKHYVGQTVDEFCWRWNNYKSNDREFQRLEPCIQEHLFSHCLIAGHNRFLNDVSITWTRLIHLILYREKITEDKHLKQWFRMDLILKMVPGGCFFCLLFYMITSVFLHGYVSMF